MEGTTAGVAQAELFETLKNNLLRFFRARGLTHTDACDAINDTFCVVVTKWYSRTSAASERAWVYGIAHNKVRERRRSRRNSKVVSLAGDEPELVDVPHQSDWSDVEEVLRPLSSAEREAVELVYIAELTPEEAAEVLGISRSAVYERIRSARVKLRKEAQDVA
jgi:RNA polymerase sigma-70 factor (ECF subfamily)